MDTDIKTAVDVWLTPQEASLEIRPRPIGARSIVMMFDAGKIRGVRTPSGRRLIPRSEIERLNQCRLLKANRAEMGEKAVGRPLPNTPT